MIKYIARIKKTSTARKIFTWEYKSDMDIDLVKKIVLEFIDEEFFGEGILLSLEKV